MSEVEDDYLEWYVEDKFEKALTSNGWITFKTDIRGFPDRFCFGPDGCIVLVEFKRTGARARKGEKLQRYYEKIFRKLGFKYYKVAGEEDAEKLRDRLLAKGSAISRN